MILLPGTTLQVVLAAAVAANQLDVHVDFVDYNGGGEQTSPSTVRSATNSTTDVTILAAPDRNPVRVPLHLSVYNKDTGSVTVTIKTDDGTTERIAVKRLIYTGESLCYDKGIGWYVI